jgi:hypothetical protein
MMRRACGMHRKEDIGVQVSGGETRKKEEAWATYTLYARIILKQMSMELHGRLWAEFI